MSNDLFVALKRYSPRRDRTPTEEFIGAALAWILNDDRRFALKVGQYLGWIPLSDHGPVKEVTDQYSIQRKEIDVQIVTARQVHWIELKCESKVRQNQLVDYQRLLDHARSLKRQPGLLSLITASGCERTSGLKGTHRTWTDVLRAMRESQTTTTTRNRWLVENLLSLLCEENHAVSGQINSSTLKGLVKASGTLEALHHHLRHALGKLAEKTGWSYEGRETGSAYFQVGHLFSRKRSQKFKPWIYLSAAPTEGVTDGLPVLAVWFENCKPSRIRALWTPLLVRESWSGWFGIGAPLSGLLRAQEDPTVAMYQALAQVFPSKVAG